MVHGVNKVALVRGAALLSSDNPTPSFVLHQANDELVVFVHSTLECYLWLKPMRCESPGAFAPSYWYVLLDMVTLLLSPFF